MSGAKHTPGPFLANLRAVPANETAPHDACGGSDA